MAHEINGTIPVEKKKGKKKPKKFKKYFFPDIDKTIPAENINNATKEARKELF